jgi:4-hydroxythreonine-4-phosphate dehydrogenase
MPDIMPPPVTCHRLALTPGEPAGIGPDICIQLAQRPQAAELVIFADPALLEQRARRLGLPLRLLDYRPEAPPRPQSAGELTLAAVPLAAPCEPGVLAAENARYVLATLAAATDAVLRGGCAALVTGPVHKGILNAGGFTFTGHTEWLAQATGAARPVMLLAHAGLRVALATTHLPLRAVPDAITADLLDEVLRILDHALRHHFGLPAPRILVTGLNPHAGEDGHLGREELDIIIPALEHLRGCGLRLTGPVPADTAFLPDRLSQHDAVLALYHDQGLAVLKHAAFDEAVNITLGLPLIRCSVDHGTALERAGRGTASDRSLQAAVDLTLAMVQHALSL